MYIFLGGIGEVGTSRVFVSVTQRHILFDFGVCFNQQVLNFLLSEV